MHAFLKSKNGKNEELCVKVRELSRMIIYGGGGGITLEMSAKWKIWHIFFEYLQLQKVN